MSILVLAALGLLSCQLFVGFDEYKEGIIFVTSTTVPANMGSVQVGDDTCISVADPNYVRVDQQPVGDLAAISGDRPLTNPVDIDESGAKRNDDVQVWTGSLAVDTCSKWTTNTPSLRGEAGRCGETGPYWTDMDP
jgi:hypothetical protein